MLKNSVRCCFIKEDVSSEETDADFGLNKCQPMNRLRHFPKIVILQLSPDCVCTSGLEVAITETILGFS